MQPAAGHRVWLGPVVALLFGLALTWGLLRFGGAETEVLYRLFLFLLVPATVALLAPPWRRGIDLRLLIVGLVGVFLLGTVVLQPTLEARGALHLTVGWLALWLALWLSRQSAGQRHFLVVVLVLLGALEAFYGLVQSVGGFDYIGSYFRNRGRIATGTLINRNHYAALLNMILPLALGLLFAAQARRRERPATRSESLAKTWIVLLGCSVMGVAVLSSQSRGGTLSLLVTLLFMALLLSMSRRQRSKRGVSGLAAVVLLCLIAAMGAAFGLEALFERFGRIEENLSRVDVYRDTVDMISEAPWAGVGPGMYRWTFRTYQEIQPGTLYDHAHNDYLETAAEWGVPLALLAWGFVVWRFFRSAVVSMTSRDPWRQGLALGTAGALFSILVHSLVDFSLQIPAIFMVFACILALSWTLDLWPEPAPAPARSPASVPAGASRSTDRPVRPSRMRLGTLPGIALRIFLLLAILVCGWTVLQRARAADAARPENGVPGLERSLALDPAAPEPHFLLGMAYRDLPGTGTAEQALDELRAAVRLNPYAWRYWLELSATQELLGQTEDAEDSMRVAVRLNPASGAYRWRLANLLVRRGALDQAVPEIAEAVRLEPHLAEPAVALLVKLDVEAEVIRELLPDDRAALVRLLRLLRRRPASAPSETMLAAVIWSRLLADPDPLTVAEGRTYVDRLLREGRFAEARSAWLELATVNGLTDPDYERDASRVWNGDFELEPVGAPFGWRLGRADDYEILRQAGTGIDGSAALRVEFFGRENVNFAGVSQSLILEPESTYRLSFSIKTEGLSTDEGVYVELLSREPNSVLVTTEPVLGTTDWLLREAIFTAPEGSGQALLRLRRRPSRQIDSKLRGTVWLDSVKIEAVNP